MNPLPSPKPPIQDQPEDPGPDEPDSSDPAGAIQVEVVNHTDTADEDLCDWLESQVRRAVALCEVVKVELTLAIVADEEMAELHEQYTGVAGTTDVLTFDLAEPAAGGLPPGDTQPPTTLEGDIVVCIDEADRQARARNHETRKELLLYAVHGLMHLLGEDDHSEKDYQRMHAREDTLLTEMGFGPLFDPERSFDPNP